MQNDFIFEKEGVLLNRIGRKFCPYTQVENI